MREVAKRIIKNCMFAAIVLFAFSGKCTEQKG